MTDLENSLKDKFFVVVLKLIFRVYPFSNMYMVNLFCFINTFFIAMGYVGKKPIPKCHKKLFTNKQVPLSGSNIYLFCFIFKVWGFLCGFYIVKDVNNAKDKKLNSSFETTFY